MLKGQKIFLSTDIPKESRAWRNDPTIWKWCRQYKLISEAEQFVWVSSLSSTPSVYMLGIYDPYIGVRDIPVGVCGLTSIDRHNQSAEFSIYIAPDHQGNGYAEDALKVLLRHAFSDWNLNRVWGEVYSGNPALENFERVGFRREGILRQAYFRDGKFIDCHRIGILREDFYV